MTATFWVLAPIAVLAALGMVLVRKAVHSALLLATVMMCLALMYASQDAPFLFAVQVIVYTGAILMLFLFVLMLVGRDTSDALIETLRGQRTAAIVLGIGFAGLVCTGVYRATRNFTSAGLDTANSEHGGNAQGIAALLYTRYVFAFEVTSALLITAAVGAMLLAHVERRKEDRVTQLARMKARFAPGSYPGPKPGPGVYATSDSVATPALLPDGTFADRSISKILPTRELSGAEAAPKGTEK
jgi:NADH-quinone oxidoreductase subunit J